MSQTVSYEIGGEAAGGKVGGSTTVSFSAGYGEDTGKTETVEVGSEAGLQAEIPPGKEYCLRTYHDVGSGRSIDSLPYEVSMVVFW